MEEHMAKFIKRFLAVYLAGALMFSFAACGGEGRDNADDVENNGNAQTAGNTDENDDPNNAGQNNAAGATTDGDSDILVVYFSATGTTKGVAEKIAQAAGADLVEIVPQQAYTEDDLDYNDDGCRANREQNDEDARPQISGSIENWDSYQVVLIGHPIWWGEEPRIIDTFMESYDFAGKQLANFCTSGGSGISTSSENIRAMAPGAEWLGGQRFSSGTTLQDAQDWLEELGVKEAD